MLGRDNKIKNICALTSHGDRDSRKLVLSLAEATLKSLDSYNQIKKIMNRNGPILSIGNRRWDLSKKKNVFLIGAGKACNAMAMAVDEILGSYLTKGIAIVKIQEDSDHYQNTEVYVGGHPLPDEGGLSASRKILELVQQAGPEDLFIAVMSGGSSALMNCPVPGISPEDERSTTDILLKSGAGILEINAVRRHISQTNGGMLAKAIQERGAELIGIGISDAVGVPRTLDMAEPYVGYKGTPIGPDPTTFEDARNVIRKLHLEALLPQSVISYLFSGTQKEETPKAFPDNTYYLLNSVPDSCFAAAKLADEMKIPSVILTCFLEGESREAGTFLASLARQIQQYKTPFKPPCMLIFSGETTTHIPPGTRITGHGGPSQELAASFALSAAQIPGACLFSIDSEGSDGTSNAAGGLTDSRSAASAAELHINLRESLYSHSTFEALSALGDVVITGNTGTNLCDFNLLYVPELKS